MWYIDNGFINSLASEFCCVLFIKKLTIWEKNVEVSQHMWRGCSLRSQKYNIDWWGWEGGEMDDLKECNYLQVSQLFLSKIVAFKCDTDSKARNCQFKFLHTIILSNHSFCTDCKLHRVSYVSYNFLYKALLCITEYLNSAIVYTLYTGWHLHLEPLL